MNEEKEGRVARRRRRNRQALIQAGEEVISSIGIDAATIEEIAGRADVSTGTVYSFFKSKDELAVAVFQTVAQRLAAQIEAATVRFDDPAHAYAFGIRSIIETAASDVRWKQLLRRPEMFANALFHAMGPCPLRHIERATHAGRFKVTEPALVWLMTSHAIVGMAMAITGQSLSHSAANEAVVRLLCMTGIPIEDAYELASRPCP